MRPSGENSVPGSATEFCQVVTQVRNVADTKLDVRGADGDGVDGHGAVLCGRGRAAAEAGDAVSQGARGIG